MIGFAAGAGTASVAIQQSIKTTTDLAKSTSALTRLTGLSSQEASRWVSAAKARGVEGKALNTGFVSLARNMQAATDKGSKQADVFKKLGVSQELLKRGDAGPVVVKLADAFTKIKSPAEKAATAQKLFGRQASTLLPLLDAGSKGLREQLALSDKYGTTLNKNQVREALKAAQAQRELGMAFDGLKVTVGNAVIPTFTRAVGALANFAAEVRSGEGAGGRFRVVMENVAASVRNIVSAITPMVASFGKFTFELLQNRAAVGGLVGGLTSLAAVLTVNQIVGMVGALGSLRTVALVVGSALVQLRVGLIGVSTAMVRTGFGALIVAAGVLAGALLGMKSGTEQARQTFIRLGDATDRAKGALDRYRGAVDGVKDANLAHKGAVLALRTAEVNLDSLRRSGTASALDIKNAEHQVALARREVARSAQDEKTAEASATGEKKRSIATATKQLGSMALRAAGGRRIIGVLRGEVAELKRSGASAAVVKFAQDRLRTAMVMVANRTGNFREQLKLLRSSGLSARDKMEVLKGSLRRLESAGQGASDQARTLRQEIDRLKSKKIKVNVGIAISGAGIPDAPFGGGKDYGTGVEKAVVASTKAWAKRNQGKLVDLGGVGSLGGGKASSVDQFRGLAARFGTHTGGPGQGFRPGDPGWHGKNRARDFSGGNMLGFARAMASRFGRNLIELIHTPLGFGIKNGKRVAPYAQADHYDHVHVAMRRGGTVAGRGSGDTVPAMLTPGEEVIRKPVAKKIRPLLKALNAQRLASGGTVARAAMSAGFRGGNLLRAVAEAKGESGWNERAVGDGGASKGLMQIHTGWNPWAGGLNLFNPRVNMKAAMRIFKSQGWGAWHANHLPHIAAARAAIASAGGARGGGGGKGGRNVATRVKFGKGVSDSWKNPGVGRTIAGAIAGSDALQTGIERESGNFTSSQAIAGVDSDSLQGLQSQRAFSGGQLGRLQGQQVVNKRALAKARRRGNPKQIAAAQAEVDEVADQILGLSGSIADLDKTIADRTGPQAQAEMNSALAGLTETLVDDQAAQKTRVDLAQQELVAARASNDPTRIAEAANALKSEIEAMKSLEQAIRDQTRVALEAATAQAGLTATLSDDLPAQLAEQANAEEEWASARKSGDKARIAAAADNLKREREETKALKDKIINDPLERDAALAALTDTLDDDIVVAKARVKASKKELDAALASGDDDRITEAAINHKANTDALKGLTESTDGNTAAVEDNTSATEELVKVMKDQIDYANSVSAITSTAAVRALADMITGQLGPRVAVQRQSAGSADVGKRY